MKRVIIQCDACGKECGHTYFTIYKNEGEHVTDKVELCKACCDNAMKAAMAKHMEGDDEASNQ